MTSKLSLLLLIITRIQAFAGIVEYCLDLINDLFHQVVLVRGYFCTLICCIKATIIVKVFTNFVQSSGKFVHK